MKASMLAGFLALLVMTIASYCLRDKELENAKADLQSTVAVVAEHTSVVLGEALYVARTIKSYSEDVAPWRSWPSKTFGRNVLAQRHQAYMPHIRRVVVYDKRGQEQFSSFAADPLVLNVGDRPYWKWLTEGAQVTYFGPYVGRHSNATAYNVMTPIEFSGAFDGAVQVIIEPIYLRNFCQLALPTIAASEAAIVGMDNKIMSYCSKKNTQDASTEMKPYNEVMGGGVLFKNNQSAENSVYAGYIAKATDAPLYVVGVLDKTKLQFASYFRWLCWAIAAYVIVCTAVFVSTRSRRR